MDTKKITVLAMISAIAYIMAAFARIPVVLFLRYDPKDIIITIGGFIYGPVAALMVTVVVSVLQMFTTSQTGLWGLLMNVIGSAAFCCTAAYVYKNNRTLKGAVYGLIGGFILSTAAMLMWNYFILPIYMNMAREDITGLLLTAILPFNLIKNGLNVAFTILLYKQVKKILKSANLLPRTTETVATSSKINIAVVMAAILIATTCIMWVLVLQGII